MVRLLQSYAKMRPGTLTGPLFIWQSGTQVEAKEVRFGLRQYLEATGESPRGLSPKSFHIWAVSEAAKKGESEAQLRMMGHWRSNAYMRYVRPTQHMPPQ